MLLYFYARRGERRQRTSAYRRVVKEKYINDTREAAKNKALHGSGRGSFNNGWSGSRVVRSKDRRSLRRSEPINDRFLAGYPLRGSLRHVSHSSGDKARCTKHSPRAKARGISPSSRDEARSTNPPPRVEGRPKTRVWQAERAVGRHSQGTEREQSVNRLLTRVDRQQTEVNGLRGRLYFYVSK